MHNRPLFRSARRNGVFGVGDLPGGNAMTEAQFRELHGSSAFNPDAEAQRRAIHEELMERLNNEEPRSPSGPGQRR